MFDLKKEGKKIICVGDSSNKKKKEFSSTFCTVSLKVTIADVLIKTSSVVSVVFLHGIKLALLATDP